MKNSIPARRAAAPLLLALLLLLGFAGRAAAEPVFPALSGRVVDAADLLSPAEEAAVTNKLAALEADTGRQLVVATLPDLQGYAIEDYGYRLGRAWAIGSKERDDGVLLIVAPKERKVRIEVGYGLEPVLTDALSSVIIHQAMLPKFRAGDMAGGVIAGADALIQQLRLPDEEAKARVVSAQKAAQQGGEGVPFGFLIFLFILFVFILPRLFGRRGPVVIWGPGMGGGWGGRRGGGGGFSGGGGSFGGGGASGGW